MATPKKGAVVRQIIVPIEGTVTDYSVDKETGDLLIKVEWLTADGDEHSKFFKPEEISEVKAK